MLAAIGIKTGKVYSLSNYKSTLFLRLQKEYQFKSLNDGVYPEALVIQRVRNNEK